MNTCGSSRLKFPTLSAFIVASGFAGLGVWVLAQDQGKNMLSTFPLFWLLVLVSAPPLSAWCAAALWRDRVLPPWVALVATVLAVVQLFVWAFVVLGVLHYS